MGSQQPHRALFVTPYYLPELIGSGPYCADIAETLLAKGVAVTVLTARPHYPANVVFSNYRDGTHDSEIYNGVAVERFNPFVTPESSALRRMMSEGLFLLQGIWALLRGRAKRCQLVVSLCPSILAVLLGAIATRRGGRHVAVVHDIQSGLMDGLAMVKSRRLVMFIRWLERFSFNRADLVLVPSPEMQRQLERLGVTSPIEIVPIWVDTARFRPIARTPDKNLTVMYSGNLGRKQALQQVMALAAAFRDRQAHIRIKLRGDGNQAAALAREVERRGLTNVEMWPLLPAESVNQGMADGDIHLVPQNPHAGDFAVPSKIFAIMAAGRPFVATADENSALRRIERESQAFICVPPDDTEALANAVLALAADENRRREYGTRGRNYVVANHTREKVLEGLCHAVFRGT